jgi:hypothetical protein
MLNLCNNNNNNSKINKAKTYAEKNDTKTDKNLKEVSIFIESLNLNFKYYHSKLLVSLLTNCDII